MEVVKIRRLVNPYRKTRGTRPRTKARPRKAARNPASILTLGMLNPERAATRKKGQTKMTKAAKKAFVARMKRSRAKTRKANPHRRRRTATAAPRRRASNPTTKRRRNSTRIYVMPKRNGRRRRSNPEVFGMRGSAAGKAILAGLVGVYATKTVTPIVGNAIPTVGSSPIFSAILSAAIAWGGGMMLAKWDKTAGEGFMFGGLMQAGSQLLNLVVPANPLSLSGLGDFVPARFSVPENPILRGSNGGYLAAPATVPAGVGAVAMFR